MQSAVAVATTVSVATFASLSDSSELAYTQVDGETSTAHGGAMTADTYRNSSNTNAKAFFCFCVFMSGKNLWDVLNCEMNVSDRIGSIIEIVADAYFLLRSGRS